jgi:AbiV family abortive infection protein
MDAKTRTLLSEMSRGAQLTFTNAEELCAEGDLLRRNGSMNRALFLHQISLEECGKIEIIGAWATNLLLGAHVDVPEMTKAFRSHQAKNYANAYFATPTAAELEARARGDTRAAVEAFERFQKRFHNESNAAKNASLYVDFTNNSFSTPSEVITEEMVIGIATVNLYFLRLTGPKVRMLGRMSKDEGALERTIKGFSERAADLRAQKPEDAAGAMEALMQEIFSKYKSERGAE